MRSCGTRSTKRYGPAHTGLLPNWSPSACAALGETMMPARSANCASSGENGVAMSMRTVSGSTASTLLIALISLLRRLSGRVSARSRLNLTAAASNGSPS